LDKYRDEKDNKIYLKHQNLIDENYMLEDEIEN